MKGWNRVKSMLLASFMLTLMVALSVHAQDAVKQQPVYLTISGLKGAEVTSGDVLTFTATGGDTEEYFLEITVDGNIARFPLGRGKSGSRTFRVGGMNNDGTILPPGRNYSVRAYCARTLAHELKFETEYSKPQTFKAVYPDPKYYRIRVFGATREYDPYHEQYVLEFPPRLVYDDGNGWGARDCGDQEQRGAVDRFEIYDQYGNLVSQDGTVKDPGTYKVVVYQLFDDPLTGQTVCVKSNTTYAHIVQKVTASLTPAPAAPQPATKETVTVVESATEEPAAEEPAVATPVQFSAGVTQPVAKVLSNTANSTAKPAAASAAKTAEAVKVDKTSITLLKNNKSKKAALKFKKVKDAAGYQIMYSTSGNFKKGCTTTITTKKNSVTLKKLAKKKTYYVKVRAFKKNSAGETVYGKYSAVKKVKIKK